MKAEAFRSIRVATSAFALLLIGACAGPQQAPPRSRPLARAEPAPEPEAPPPERVSEPEPEPESAPETITIHGFRFVLPVWWHEVDAQLPEGIDTEQAIRAAVTERCGEDTGTAETWREAMKLWVEGYIRRDGLPVYIAHAYRAGGHHIEAARAFANMHALARDQGELAEWYDAYLAYNAGVSYREAGEESEAVRFFTIAARLADSVDSAVGYYARESRSLLSE